MIKIPPKYKELYTTDKPIILITGGRGSAKSFNATTFAERLSFEQGHIILFSRYTMSAADKSIIPELKEKIDLDGTGKYFKINKNDILNLRSDSKILFSGIKTSSGNQTAKLKSIQGLTTFFVDEAEEWESEDEYDTIKLSIRKKGVKNRVIIVMNPSNSEHFIYQKYIKDTHKIIKIYGVDVQISTHPEVLHIHTTYLDNLEHLSDEFLNEINEIKAKHDELTEDKKNTSKYAYKILGRWSDKAEGVIFENWREGEFNDSLPYGYGQDYGFSIDPTTLIKMAVDVKRKICYWHEEYYGTKSLGTDDIYEMNKARIKKPNDLIVGDSAEKRLISDLKKKRLNIIEAVKGAGSVSAGITAMLDYEHVITPESKNIKYEFNNYVWSDKKANIPEDDNNHAIDAGRYIFNKLVNPRKKAFGATSRNR